MMLREREKISIRYIESVQQLIHLVSMTWGDVSRACERRAEFLAATRNHGRSCGIGETMSWTLSWALRGLC